MRQLLLICAGLLLWALADLPIGYFTLLRIIVSIGAVATVVTEFEKGINYWVIEFRLTGILFNPFFSVYLRDKRA